jgi:hypothetical protein
MRDIRLPTLAYSYNPAAAHIDVADAEIDGKFVFEISRH